jgi:hypothetical protein
MHTVELLREALAAAERLGYKLRVENLAGTGGGVCVIAGRKHLFVELAQSPAEQLEVVVEALRNEPGLAADPWGPSLARLADGRQAA